VLTLSDITKAFGPDLLFEKISLQVNRGDRIGLIGPNGAGKSTLFSIILGEEFADEGDVALQRGTRIGYLPQENAAVVDSTVLDLATHEKNHIESGGGTGESEALLHGEAHHESEYYQKQAEAKSVLKGLGFREEDFDRPVKEFSGGWIMRVHLARLLVDEPDILLLDEPTNHLDLDSLDWFQSYLKGNYSGAVLVISHDRHFLNSLIKRIVELDRKSLVGYTGDYDSYVEQKAAREEQYRAAYANQEREIRRLQTFVDRFGAKASKASQAQSKRKQIERLRVLDAPEQGESTVSFRFPQPTRSGAKVLELNAVSHAYGEKVIYRNIGIEIERGQRTAIVGPNGAGKTTLLKIMSGDLPLQAGHRELGHNVYLGYFSQHRAETLNLSNSVLEEALQSHKAVSEQTARTLLGAFLFRGDEVFKSVSVLSGGEKSRLALVKLLLDPPNLLLMDEPTTHLDIPSIEALINALRHYEGTLLFVSHDVYFIRTLASSVLSVRSGELKFYLGDYNYYLEKSGAISARAGLILGSSANEVEKVSETKRGNDRDRKRIEAEERNQRSRKKRELENELRKIEGRILELEERQKLIAGELEQPDFHANSKLAAQSAQELKEIVTALEKLTPHWEQLAETVSQMRAS
jgi:ATP-binding cassette, subfamily F, member 3